MLFTDSMRAAEERYLAKHASRLRDHRDRAFDRLMADLDVRRPQPDDVLAQRIAIEMPEAHADCIAVRIAEDAAELGERWDGQS
jgi:hypothetical protein